MMNEPRQIHVVGAGMAGLSASLQLALMGENVILYEAAPYAGGRCRSYYDRELDCRIDNGNHLVLSGNVAIQDYLYLSRANESVKVSPDPMFPFMDLETGERWTIKMNKGRCPWWIFDAKRRIPGTKPTDYLSVLRVMMSGQNDTVASRVAKDTKIYRRFWEPLAVSALNTEPELASARLLANLFAQSFGAGGKACCPVLPTLELSETFVMPCLNTLRQHGVEVKFGHRLRSIGMDNTTIRQLVFGHEVFYIGPRDWVILAVPAWVAQDLIPNLIAPNQFRSIVNAHYRIEAPHNPVGFTGCVGSVAEWVFVKPGVVSVTISCADRYEEAEQRHWAIYVWRDVAKLFDLDPNKLPPWRIVQEKRATFAATPEQIKRRPLAYTGWANLALAGDWTDTSLPSTIEGAIRSGVKAAQVVRRWAA